MEVANSVEITWKWNRSWTYYCTELTWKQHGNLWKLEMVWKMCENNMEIA